MRVIFLFCSGTTSIAVIGLQMQIKWILKTFTTRAGQQTFNFLRRLNSRVVKIMKSLWVYEAYIKCKSLIVDEKYAND